MNVEVADIVNAGALALLEDHTTAGLFNDRWPLDGGMGGQLATLVHRQGLHLAVNVDMARGGGSRCTVLAGLDLSDKAMLATGHIGLHPKIHQHDGLIWLDEIPIALVLLLETSADMVFECLT